MKYILVIGDGMADNPVEELGGRTPVEAAQKPFFDELARRGTVGSVKTIPEGFLPGSDTAIMSIFGCDPRKCYSGRAPLELAASGGVMPAGGAAYRCNMVTLEGDGLPFEQRRMKSHSAGSIEGAESDQLVTELFASPEFRALADEARLTVRPGSSFRHLAVQADVDITGLRLIPPHDHLGDVIGDLLPRGCANAAVLLGLMRKAHELLEHHPINERRCEEGKLPANGIWFWAEGRGAALPNFKEAYGSGGVISAVPLCHGIAVLTGLSPVTVPTATGEWDTDYAAKVRAVLKVLETEDFAALHLEGPDEATHNNDLIHKVFAVECLSELALRPIAEELRRRGEPFRLLVLSDHKTLMSNGAHDGDPVPFLLYDSRETERCGRPYSEISGAQGPYLEAGTELMPLLFKS